MAYIQLHVGAKRHRKLIECARDLRCKRAYLLGHLSALWLEVMELSEDGDISRWSDDVIAEAAGYTADPTEFVTLLLAHKWLDGDVGNGASKRLILVHDWPDYAGRYLIRRYSSSPKGRLRLAEIWAKHGRVYGDDSKKKGGHDPPCDPVQVTNGSQVGHQLLSPLREDKPSEDKDWQSARALLPFSSNPLAYRPDLIPQCRQAAKHYQATVRTPHSTAGADAAICQAHLEGHSIEELMRCATIYGARCDKEGVERDKRVGAKRFYAEGGYLEFVGQESLPDERDEQRKAYIAERERKRLENERIQRENEEYERRKQSASQSAAARS